jgi:hypothetical protein
VSSTASVDERQLPYTYSEVERCGTRASRREAGAA